MVVLVDDVYVPVGTCPACSWVESLESAYEDGRAEWVKPPVARWQCPNCAHVLSVNVLDSRMPLADYQGLANYHQSAAKDEVDAEGLQAWLDARGLSVPAGVEYRVNGAESLGEAENRFKAELVGRVMQGFRIDLDAVETVDDLMLYWQRPYGWESV